MLGRSPENDLAVLKVDATDLPSAKLGSSDELQVGDEVIAIGNALALEGGLSVTRGIISAKDRTVPGGERRARSTASCRPTRPSTRATRVVRS